MLGDPFAERQVDPVGVVDEEAQRFGARLLDGDQVELRVELGELLLDVLLGGLLMPGSGRKKSGPGPLLDTRTARDEKSLSVSIAPACRHGVLAGYGTLASARELVDPVEDRLGDRVLGGLRDRGLVARRRSG